MISKQEYREDYINSIQIDAAENNRYEVEVFIDDMTDVLKEDLSLVNDMEQCYFSFKEGTKSFKNMQIDAGFLDLTANVLNLLIADFDIEKIKIINNDFINNKIKLMVNYFENVLKGYFNNAEETNPATQLAMNILKNIDSISKIHLFIISTNEISKRIKRLEFADFKYKDRTFKLELDIIDINRLYDTKLPSFTKEQIIISTRDFNCDGIQCIKADIGKNNYDAYLAIVPGKFLCDIYKKYGPGLLESNVRSFLSARGAVNKGIRTTILTERKNFFTYNNGISTIAKEIVIEEIPEKGRCITSFKDFQIINGGQTTASLASADIKDKANLDNIFVPMKLTIVKEDDSEFVHNISKYANSQNKVTNADLNSNHPFYVEIENFSRKIKAPHINGQTYGTKWFFERARGQYEQPKMSMTKSERANYDRENPKSQKFNKAELAKYINSAEMKPFDVSKGAEQNLRRFQCKLEEQWNKDRSIYNELFYRELIAKAILFKKIEKIISNEEWYIEKRAYRSQLVTYTFSKLIYEIQKNNNSELNYLDIWNKQDIPAFLIEDIRAIAYMAFETLYDSNATIANIGEYSKREACWNSLKDKPYNLTSKTIDYLISKEDKKIALVNAQKDQRQTNSLMIEIQVFNFGAKYWENLLKLDEKLNVLNEKDKQFLKYAIQYCNGIQPQLSKRQAEYIWYARNKLEKYGVDVNGI